MTVERPASWALWLHDDSGMDWLLGVGDIVWAQLIHEDDQYSRKYSWIGTRVACPFTVHVNGDVIRGNPGDTLCVRVFEGRYVNTARVFPKSSWPHRDFTEQSHDPIGLVRPPG
jgi:hypothetical protein